jgi:hypothetical protein
VTVDGVLFFAIVAGYGLFVLVVTAHLTGRQLIATLVVAALVRGMKGFESPLRGARAD